MKAVIVDLASNGLRFLVDSPPSKRQRCSEFSSIWASASGPKEKSHTESSASQVWPALFLILTVIRTIDFCRSRWPSPAEVIETSSPLSYFQY